ncbi:MAG: hypothetical protein IPH31_18250, partial [Lewinellaceae bacterium]|nr:hypothetical protein [Lewinellaceae bacterium]
TSFVNNATATGTSPGGTTVTDNSVNGSLTRMVRMAITTRMRKRNACFIYPKSWLLGLPKRNVKTELLPDGSANVPFEFNLENFGNVNLNNLTLTDDLAATFPTTCAVTVMSLTSDDFIVDPAFNGGQQQYAGGRQ